MLARGSQAKLKFPGPGSDISEDGGFSSFGDRTTDMSKLHFAERGRILLAALVLASGPLFAEPTTKTSEVRAIWVTRWDFRTASDVHAIVKNCAEFGLNRIYLQVRGRGDAFYRSALEPWGEEIGGRDPGFDPLALALEESHRRGIELHAWVNVLSAWKGKKPPKSRSHLWHAHPEWFLLDKNGKRYRLDDHYTMLNPCSTPARRHVTRVMVDIVTRYPVDGLHLDYIRFVFPDSSRKHAVPYDAPSLHVFRKVYGGTPEQKPTEWDAFRKRAVNTVVYSIQEGVRRARPGCRLSAAVIRDLDRGRRVFFQDSPTWLAQGWIDEILPMNYERKHEDFSRNTRMDMILSSRAKLIPGLGAHLYRSANDLRRQVEISRTLGAPGYCLFAYASFFSSPSHTSKGSASERLLRKKLRATLRDLNRSSGRPRS